MSLRRAELLTVWIPAILASVIFVVYAAQIRGEPFVKYLVANPLVYDRQAGDLLAGLPRDRSFFLSPLYPAFLAAVYFLTGRSRLALLLVQGLLMGINVGLVGLIARSLFSRFTAVVAALLMVFYWSFYYFAGEVLPATLCVGFVLAAVLAFLERNRPRPSRAGMAYLAFAGLLFAVFAVPAVTSLPALVAGTALALPGRAYWAALAFFLVFAVLECLFVLALGPRRRPGTLLNLGCAGSLIGVSGLVWGGTLVLAPILGAMLLVEHGRRRARLAVFLLGLAIPMAAGLAHNYTVSREPVPLTTSFGVNLFIGNNPAGDGMDPFKLGPGDSTRIEADRLALTGMRRSHFFRDQAFRFISGEPARWLRLIGRKAVLSIGRIQIDNNADISERRHAWRYLFLPLVNFGMIFPFAAVGTMHILLRDRKALVLPLGYLGFLVVGLLLFVCERFRLPGIALLIPVAAYGLVGLADGIRGRARPGICVSAAVFAIAAVASNVDWLRVSHAEFPSIIVNKAYVERMSGNYSEARKLALTALEREPENAGAYFQLGAIADSLEAPREAIRYYLESLRRDPFHIASYRGARRILENVRVSPSYLDRMIDQALKGEDSRRTEALILGAVAARLH
jgi:4-amino-4-deoxy-L-arabinose transferase-like glycosyltransferase